MSNSGTILMPRKAETFGACHRGLVSMKEQNSTRTIDHPLYRVWLSMKARCDNPGHHDYKNYGGRGITVCERWQHDFAAFAEDMGPKPSYEKSAGGMAVYSLDRIDNDGSYGPGNCRWATWKDQARNKRPFLRKNGKRMLDELDVVYALCCLDRGIRSGHIATRLGVRSSVISNIKSGLTWGRITGRVKP